MADSFNIPSASAEYQARFERPCIGFIGADRPRVVEAIVSALLPYGFRLAHSDVVTTGSLADQKMNFRIPDRGIALSLTAEEFRFTKEGADWTTAEADTEILSASEHAVLEGSSATISSCAVTVAIHVQPLNKTREELLTPFIPQPFRSLANERNASSYGTHLKWANGDVLLDFSGVFANGIFMRFSSQFAGHPRLDEILRKVRAEEIALLRLLGLETTQ